MEYKVVPFMAQLKSDDNASAVASQMQSVIDSYVKQGWEYQQIDSVQTYVAGTKGCFGFGAKPGYSTINNVMIFKK
ncbi:MAG TPA: hypothetical protein VKR58_01180 [Aquella sp.]|nr:hypothetical protein [Aquella sp.]